MKLSILAAALVAAAVAGQPTLAQSPKPMDKSAQTAPAAPNPAEFDKQLAQMREHMLQTRCKPRWQPCAACGAREARDAALGGRAWALE